eukprot:scaffold7040_cov256-Pinguiococcus_pyrenoidosus.AAC.6
MRPPPADAGAGQQDKDLPRRSWRWDKTLSLRSWQAPGRHPCLRVFLVLLGGASAAARQGPSLPLASAAPERVYCETLPDAAPAAPAARGSASATLCRMLHPQERLETKHS